jgi:hypothetical protein
MNMLAALWPVAGAAVCLSLSRPLRVFLSAQTPSLLPAASIHNFLLIIVSARILNFAFNKINQVESK